MKKALHSFLLMCLITAQLFLPMKAYAFPPALVWAFGASVGLHAGALLFKLDDIQQPAAAGATGGGGVSFKLDGKPTVTPPGWNDPTTPPATSSGSPTSGTWASARASGSSTLFYYRTDNSSEKTLAYQKACQSIGRTFNGSGCVSSSSISYLTIVNYGTTTMPACATGYTGLAPTCTLSDASAVKKPSGVECEFVYKAGKFVPDPQNPACDGKAINTISRTGCDLTTSEQKLFMNCPATNSTVEMTPTQLTATSDEGTFTVPATVDETGAYTVSVPSNVQNIKGFDDRDLENLSSFTNKITVDFYGSTNKTEWGCIGGTGACSHVSVDPAGSGGSSTNTSSGGATGGTGGTTGGSTGGTTGGTTGDGSGTGTGTGDASGGTTGTGDLQGMVDGALGKIGDFFKPVTDGIGAIKDWLFPPKTEPAFPAPVPVPKSSVPVALQTGDQMMGASTCPPPVQVTINPFGFPFTLEYGYTPFCEVAVMARPYIVLLSYISAMFIIFRRD